eukprot:TRINITY_DN12238_c0_g1_i2.p1 TRINITY_DN12238_c0_g1~~TRINITY_DN12238_c0_g1_i2.p1  ORF type:complete len:555 (-),score=26.43 TRINITY_DN12238_c0_g1_i2:52-1716(-)
MLRCLMVPSALWFLLTICPSSLVGGSNLYDRRGLARTRLYRELASSMALTSVDQDVFGVPASNDSFGHSFSGRSYAFMERANEGIANEFHVRLQSRALPALMRRARVAMRELDEDVIRHLMLVSVMPMEALRRNGWLRIGVHNTVDSKLISVFRPVIYFSLSTILPDELLTVVESGKEGDHDNLIDRPLVVMIPYRSLEHRILNFWPFTTAVVGDINLKTVDALIMHPEGTYLPLSHDAASRIRSISYGKEGKHESVNSWLKNNGYAYMTSYSRVAEYRWSIQYAMPGGQIIELGAGIQSGHGISFGNSTATFIRTKYVGKTSFGPENMPVVSNNATSALMPLTLMTFTCECLLDFVREGRQLSAVSAWKGWALIGDFLFAMLRSHAYVLRTHYEARESQLKAWQTCKALFTLDSNYNGRGGVFGARGSRLMQLKRDAIITRLMVPNMAATLSSEKNFYSTYSLSTQQCADVQKTFLSEKARVMEKAKTGDLDWQLPTYDVPSVELNCDDFGWFLLFDGALAKSIRHVKHYHKLRQKEERRRVASRGFNMCRSC